MVTKKQYEEALIQKKGFEEYNIPIPPVLLGIIEEFESQLPSETPIYDKLVAENKFGVSDEKAACIQETVDELMSDVPNATDPGLLLGKIQCGKTDTFETIIGLAFDRGIDIAIVLTKGTKALVSQTITRMQDDYRFFKENDELDDNPTIIIEDIMNNRKGFNKARINSAKTVIVAKKEATNLKHLINIFNKDKWMCDKKVLIVDDEADFASRNYRTTRQTIATDEDGSPKKQKTVYSMAKISEQIDELRNLPVFCRYLQVTATPYSLFLQPDGCIDIVGGKAMPFRPRFTKLVPVHNNYIGGQQYFVDSKNPNSMFHHLYHSVSQKCIDVLGKKDARYLTSGIASGNILGLTQALLSYFIASAIRSIQSRREGGKYKSSAVFHVNIDKDNHEWQNELIETMLKQLNAYFTADVPDDLRLDAMIREIYNDMKVSNRKARTSGKINPDGSVQLITATVPDLSLIKSEIRRFFVEGDINLKVVNSDNDMESLLNRENGQLRLESTINIFIGGSILDRGITIGNMLCFFYGRDPKKFQQDTVLQHARFYGSRPLEDMAVTRLFTTSNIYNALVRMNELDDQLRERFLNGLDKEDPRVTFVGYDKDIKPCAPSKIKPSKAMAITGQKIFVPKGMWTGSKKEISGTVKEIDDLITSTPGFDQRDENGFFEMTADRAIKILRKIQSTYRYDDKHDNKSQASDMNELISALHYCAEKAGRKVMALYRTDRNMKRIRENGGWVETPADGRTDLAPSRAMAIEKPVIMFFKENGKKEMEPTGEFEADGTAVMKNVGWNNTPFFWPEFLTQKSVDPVLFATDQKQPVELIPRDLAVLTEGYNDKEILKLTYDDKRLSLIDHFGEVGTTYIFDSEDEEVEFETRSIKKTTAPHYLEKDENGEFKLAEGIVPDKNDWAGVYSYNNGKFPFVLRPYKYMLLYTGQGRPKSAMLLELFPQEKWRVFAHRDANEKGVLCDFGGNDEKVIHMTDTLMNSNCEEKDIEHTNLCQWVIQYPVKKVLKYVDFVALEKES